MSLSFLLTSLLAGATSQTYRLTSYPDDGHGCTRAAATVRDRFGAMAKVQVTAVRAYHDDRTGTCTLSLDYIAAAPVPVEATGSPPAETGTYSSLASCAADLAAQGQLFATYTQVPVAFAYCYHDSSLLDPGLSDGQYVMHIEGYGAGVEHYQRESRDLEATFGQGVADQAGAALASQGLHVARASIKNEIGAETLGPIAPSLEIAYYAPRAATFDDVVTWHASDGDCAGALSQTGALLREAGASPYLAYCSPYSEESYAGAFAEFLNDGHIKIADGPTGYAAAAACQADIPPVLAAWRSTNGWRPVGALCGIGWNGIEMQVVSTNRSPAAAAD